MSQEGGQAGVRGGAGSGRWRLGRAPEAVVGSWEGAAISLQSAERLGGGQGQPGPGRAVPATFCFSRVRFRFCPRGFGACRGRCPSSGCLLAVSQLSSEGEASVAESAASRTEGPLAFPGLRSRRALRSGGGRVSLQPEMPAVLTSWQRDRVERARTSLPDFV